MYTIATLKGYKSTDKGTELKVFIPKENLGEFLIDKHIRHAEMRFDDGRTISAEQRRKAYALIDAIAEDLGYSRDEVKDIFKFRYYAQTGEEHLSLKDCSVTDAREFIGIMLDFCVEQGVQLEEPGVLYAEDIGRYVYACLKNRKCAICGLPNSDVHHEKRVGMGRNRNKIDDSEYPKLPLCRSHHILAHSMSVEQFNNIYHIRGICAKDIETKEEDEGWNGE